MRTLSAAREGDVTGCFLAIGIAPIFHYIKKQPFLALFSTEVKLREYMQLVNVEHYTIKKIGDGQQFLECLWAQGVQVVLDPYRHEGNTRFTLVMPNTQQGNA